MNNKKLTLSEILEADKRDILDIADEDNVFIIADTGSGKTYFTVNTLCKQVEDALILVDNNGLKMQTMLADELICDTKGYHYNKITHDLEKYKGFGKPITVMTYAEFGERVKHDVFTDFLESFDLIVCDEIHNLVNYQTFNDSAGLLVAFHQLLKKYDNTKIVWLTATPYYLQVLEEFNPKISKNFIFYNYSEDKRLKRYINNSLSYLQHLEAIPSELNRYKEFFKFANGKVLIFTQKIENMKNIENSVKQLDFISPICIWSENNKNNPLSNEQLAVKNYLIKNKELIEPYNCLIINSAYETGLNIEDKDMKICICHTTNITQQVQARGRLRHDIDLLVVRTDDRKKLLAKLKINISDDMLNNWICKEELQGYLDGLNVIDADKRKLTVNQFIKNANQYGYSVEKKRKTEKGNKITRYYITKLD